MEPIPEPPQRMFGVLGHRPDIDPSFPQRSFWHLMELYGPIFKVFIGEPIIFVGSQELVNEVCDQDRFKKVPNQALVEIRALTGDGLFTAFLEEPNWGKAHRLLVPAFGPLGIRKMFDNMLDISSQLILKWDRLGPQHEINCSDDFTRLAFDTIGLCAFGYRFNEFYSEDAHPFAQQMSYVLLESGKKASRPAWLHDRWYHKDEEMRQLNVHKMHALCDQIIKERKQDPQPDQHDLLNSMSSRGKRWLYVTGVLANGLAAMLNATDKETGEKLSDDNIRYQLATLLVAGHETTSATLSFAYYNLLKHPETLLAAQKQVDEVVGDEVLTLEMLPKLTYLDAVMKETLRESSPIGQMSLNATKDQVLGGKYQVEEGDQVRVLMRALHHDPKAWGDDAYEFKPERMLDGGFQKLPPNSWKPFGNGLRACIGRGFAEQEMLINLALVLQRFDLQLADPSYELQLKSTLTIKPKDFFMKARRRQGKSTMVGLPGGISHASTPQEAHKHQQVASSQMATGRGKSVDVFFGGETGTCEGMAQSLAERGPAYGLSVSTHDLDGAAGHLSETQPSVIITSSYEGQPPANAKKFVSWLEHLGSESSPLAKTRFAVFGVGNSDWASTFHRIPKIIDTSIAKLGGQCLLDAGYSDVKHDLVGPWEEWSEQLLKVLSGKKGKESVIGMDVTVSRSKVVQALGGADMRKGTVLQNYELADASIGPAKRHMEVRLPPGSSYTAGDYLVVQPRNSIDLVHRVLAKFSLNEDDVISINGSNKKHLPTEPTQVESLLLTSVELSTLITKRQLATLMEKAEKGGDDQKALEKLQTDDGYDEILKKRISILDILEDHPKLDLPFGVYLDMLQPLVPRQYSISSSSLDPHNNPGMLEHADVASITYDVHEGPALSGHGQFHGVASTYLASRRPGDSINCFVRSTNVGFRLPTNPETPLILICAGTGLAPMRAFLQERASIKDAGVRKLGPAMLFFGCRNESKDYIYKMELEEWERQGIVEVKTAFSKPDTGPHKYVNQVLEDNETRVAQLFSDGGKILLCGSAARLGQSTAVSCKKIYSSRTGKTEEEAEEWLQKIKVDRYVSDVY